MAQIKNAPPTNAQKRAAFNFTDDVKMAAAKRQDGLCAACGESLEALIKDGEYVHAHHLIPAQCGDINNTLDVQFLKSEENCIYLCHDCHYNYGHDGNYSSGGITDPASFTRIFPYAFGRGNARKGSFGSWKSKVDQEFNRVFGPKK